MLNHIWVVSWFVVLGEFLVLPQGRTAAEESSPVRHFVATTKEDTAKWQHESRTQLFSLLRMNDLVEARSSDLNAIPFEPKELSRQEYDHFTMLEVEINSTSTRRLKALVTVPKDSEGPHPIVVSIHGHGGHRRIVYEYDSPYKAFALDLAKHGYITISTDVGQHEVYESGRTLMGERLWDVMRCADYTTTLPEADAQRLGCAGLSLGGEMAMWLGAMDPRMKATVSSGFMTTVKNLKNGHCPCWDFPGFTDNYSFSDIYSLIAPRALLCQIGSLDSSFPPPLAFEAMADTQRAYTVFGLSHFARLEIHPDGHVYESEQGRQFLDEVLKVKN